MRRRQFSVTEQPAAKRTMFLAFGVAAAFSVIAFGPAMAELPVPDFNGVYGRDAHNFPKPYMSAGAARNATITDGYNNSILRPWVVELLRRDDMVEKSGHPTVTAHSICYPESVPYVFGGTQIQILQTPSEITTIFGDPGQLRTIYMNRPHSAHVKASWYGESVGHFEGDTLVVDTVGLGVHPEAGSMGFFGTPHTRALHLVERYRFLRPDEKSIAPRPRNDSFDANAVIKGGRVLRLNFTVEDPGAYKKPWSVTLDYLPLSSRIREYVCAENVPDKDLAPLLPRADIPDF